MTLMAGTKKVWVGRRLTKYGRTVLEKYRGLTIPNAQRRYARACESDVNLQEELYWVQRAITYFRKSHKKDKYLPLLELKTYRRKIVKEKDACEQYLIELIDYINILGWAIARF